jgi:hypothetical protein
MNKVGDTVWVFDRNHRRYNYGPDGRAVGGPIFREFFRETTITGETSKSWLIWGQKIPKAGGDVRQSASGAYGSTKVYMTREAMEAAVFLADHRWRIAKAVEACTDTGLLRQVAAIVGYKAEE